jgi:nicotinate-nucleotide pyrophosphorylase (carboxylating)
MNGVLDIREEILKSVKRKKVTASIIVDEDGIIAGVNAAKEEVEKLGLSLLSIANEGSEIKKGDEIVKFYGTPKQIVMAEEILIGLLAKPSGIATRAHQFVQASGGRPKIVCGAWKKMPPSLKEIIREAIHTGGAFSRIVPHPFAYLDKNYIELLGGISQSLQAVSHIDPCSKVVQIKGRYRDIGSEACEAAEAGADIIFIDTGHLEDITPVSDRLKRLGLRKKVDIAFGGGLNLETVKTLKRLDLDIIDIGRQIVDAPILEMRMEVISEGASKRDF